jgi:hypothetical protein
MHVALVARLLTSLLRLPYTIQRHVRTCVCRQLLQYSEGQALQVLHGGERWLCRCPLAPQASEPEDATDTLDIQPSHEWADLLWHP